MEGIRKFEYPDAHDLSETGLFQTINHSSHANPLL